MTTTHKVYLAGPEVFFPNGQDLMARKGALGGFTHRDIHP